MLSVVKTILVYISYLKQHYGSNIIVVFDGYNDSSKNIKAMEQLRRSNVLSGSSDVLFDETMHVPMNQEKFLANRRNKHRFISMLLQKLATANIAAKQARDDADVLIIETALEISHANTAVVVGEDVDLLVLLIARASSHQRFFFLNQAKEMFRQKYILLIASVITQIANNIFYFYTL